MDQHTNTVMPGNTSKFFTIKILQLCLDNGLALAERRPRPHPLRTLNTLRSKLLQDPFFDPMHRPEEIEFRLRANGILFMDVLIVLARLLRVLSRHEPLTEDEMAERIDVRTQCLNQPFFDRRLVNSARPFADEEFNGDDGDEGCFV